MGFRERDLRTLLVMPLIIIMVGHMMGALQLSVSWCSPTISLPYGLAVQSYLPASPVATGTRDALLHISLQVLIPVGIFTGGLQQLDYLLCPTHKCYIQVWQQYPILFGNA